MSKVYTGGCACGAIRYEVSDEPMVMVDCQCRHCQQRSGTGHGSYLTFPSMKNVKLVGKATEWGLAGDSGNIKTHAFCPTLRNARLSDLRGDARSLHHTCREPR